MSPHTDIVIGFHPVKYNISEGNVHATIFVALLRGELIQSVQVEVSLNSGSATGKTGSGRIYVYNNYILWVGLHVH